MHQCNDQILLHVLVLMLQLAIIIEEGGTSDGDGGVECPSGVSWDGDVGGDEGGDIWVGYFKVGEARGEGTGLVVAGNWHPTRQSLHLLSPPTLLVTGSSLNEKMKVWRLIQFLHRLHYKSKMVKTKILKRKRILENSELGLTQYPIEMPCTHRSKICTT